MKRMQSYAVALIVGAGMFFITGAAQAAMISSEYGLPIVESVTEINESGNLDLFDASLGTLTGATLEIFVATTQSFSVTNNAAQMQTANVTSSVDLLWSSTLPGDPVSGTFHSFSNTTGFVGYAPGQTIAYGPFNDTDSDVFDLVGILASLIGPGQFSVSVESFSGLSVAGGGGNITVPQSTTAGGGARITYTFDPIPEPSTFLLMGAGVVGVIYGRRKNKVA